MDKRGVLLLSIFSLVGIAGWLGWQEVKAQGADWLPINYVRVEGEFQYIARDTIKQRLKKQVSAGLYNADIQQISESVQSLSWIRSVKVKRVWPDAIDIKIREQVPVVRWKDKGLVNREGEIFMPENSNEFTHLPLLIGPTGKEKQLLEIMNKVTIDLREKNMKLTEFRVSDRRAWYIKCQNNMQLIVGRNEPLVKLQRFLKTMALIGEQQLEKVATADLRYPNGYALSWKPGLEEVDWNEVAEMRKI